MKMEWNGKSQRRMEEKVEDMPEWGGERGRVVRCLNRVNEKFELWMPEQIKMRSAKVVVCQNTGHSLRFE